MQSDLINLIAFDYKQQIILDNIVDKPQNIIKRSDN